MWYLKNTAPLRRYIPWCEEKKTILQNNRLRLGGSIFRGCSIMVVLPSLVKTSYLTFFHFSRYVEIFEVPHVFYLLGKVRKSYVLRRGLETV